MLWHGVSSRVVRPRLTPALLALALHFVLVATCAAADLETQRRWFRDAYAAAAAGRDDTARLLAQRLEGEHYVLVPYIEQAQLLRNIDAVRDEDVRAFLTRENDTLVGEQVRNAWLVKVAARGATDTFLEYYRPSDSKALRCLYLEARARTGVSAELVQEARSEWLSAEVPFDACGRAFDLISASTSITDDERWQRIDAALPRGRLALVRATAAALPAPARAVVDRIIEAYRQPSAALARPETARDTPAAQRIVRVALLRLAAQDADAAARARARLAKHSPLAPDIAASVDAAIALGAVRQSLPSAADLLDRVPDQGRDAQIDDAMIRIGIAGRDFARLARWTQRPPAAGTDALRWRYWHARALELSGAGSAARPLFEALAPERDYYGFRAADRLGRRYNFADDAVPLDAATRRQLEARPALERARELLALGWRAEARREWQFAIRAASREQLLAYAGIASAWGWHDRAIATLGRAEAYGALGQRFPTPFLDVVRQHAGEQALPASTVYSVIRAESAFQEDARSPAGALGLMQLMPDTGKLTARRLGLPVPSQSALLDPRTNIALGTSYLRQLLDRFAGNLALAAAAYNAGPGRVRRWQQGAACTPAEFWVETLPFSETRQYVRRVLYFSTLYDWRLGSEVVPLGDRIRDIPARDGDTPACAATVLGMNERNR